MAILPHLSIDRCHSYDIECKYKYQCENAACGQVVPRHSKSLDLSTTRCGLCGSRFVLCSGTQLLLGGESSVPSTATPRKPNPFAEFVKVSPCQRACSCLTTTTRLLMGCGGDLTILDPTQTHFATVVAENPDARTHKERMAILSSMWQRKQAGSLL